MARSRVLGKTFGVRRQSEAATALSAARDARGPVLHRAVALCGLVPRKMTILPARS